MTDSIEVRFDASRIDELLSPFDRSDRPGVAAGIAIRGTPVYRRGLGLANMELPIVLRPSMRMRLYSITKHFTCLAYMLLCEEGRASIDDTLGKFLPELHPVTRRVTMRQLMGHTSGLRDVHDINWHFNGMGQPVTSADLLPLYRDIDDVSFPAGTSWSYNNGGYLLLTSVIERITGEPFESVLRTRIFERVGMHDTLVRRFDTDFVSNSATMHARGPGGAYEKRYMGTASAGEGGVVSTVDDMLRWLAHMDAPTIGSRETWALMKAPHMLLNGTSTDYGLGLMSGGYRGVGTLSHAGAGPGANSQMLKIPAAGLDVVVLLNSWDASAEALARSIVDACLPDLNPVPQRSGAPCVKGLFHSLTTGRVIELGESVAAPPWIKGGEQVMSLDGSDIAVEPDANGTLWASGVFARMKLGVTLAGPRENVTSIRFSEFGNVDELVRVVPTNEPVEAISGRYRSDGAGVEATISDTPDGPLLGTAGRFGSSAFRLERLAPRLWRATATGPMPWRGILSFDDDGAAFRFSSLRTRALPFRRCHRS